MSSTRTGLLVLGLGNVLLGDDGIGPAAIAHLRKHYAIPDTVHCLDGGTLGLSLLPHLEDAGAVIMIDAVAVEGPPGALVRVTGEDVGPTVATRLSPHQVGVADLLQGARWHDREPQRLVLFGIVPESIELRVGLSRPVLDAMGDLVDLVCAEAAACGQPLAPIGGASVDRDFDTAKLLDGARA